MEGYEKEPVPDIPPVAKCDQVMEWAGEASNANVFGRIFWWKHKWSCDKWGPVGPYWNPVGCEIYEHRKYGVTEHDQVSGIPGRLYVYGTEQLKPVGYASDPVGLNHVANPVGWM